MIATGVRYRRLDVPRMEEFEGASVYYAATLMEARLCTGDPVAVVGGGNSAGQATLFLARYANPVHLIVREADLAENMSRYLIDRIERSPAVQVHLHTEVRELVGEHGVLDGVVVEDNQTGERSRLDARMLFVFIGAAAPHALARGSGRARRARLHPHRAAGRRATGTVPRRTASRCCSRPAGPGCSPSGTCAAARSSASRRPWARARWPSAWCSSTSRATVTPSSPPEPPRRA